MSAVSKLQAAFVSASQETTLALANLNADFSLVKIEPRIEYRDIGGALSNHRRVAGEAGSIHVTARRLGSLFQSIVPDVSNLLAAYGKRATELSKSPDANPTGTRDHGPFQEYVGVDGSSLWAAATSGDAALAMHLLACMLATHWQAPEAIAIWVELVTERKRQLESTTASGNINLQDAVALQLVISREHLEEWDTSARAWLKATCSDPLVNERQLRVLQILKGLKLAVLGPTDVYRSVTDAWKLAMETFDKIIGGASYSIYDGAVLVALASWYLYPDLVVLTNEKREIHQHDALLQAGGIVTIGATLPDLEGPPGVRWLLSLSHLKYYGPPVTVSQSTESDEGRLTFDDFVVVSLGAIVALWNQEQYVTTENALELIDLFISRLEDTIDEVCDQPSASLLRTQTWIHPFKAAIARLQGGENRNPNDHMEAQKLFKLGVRHRSFISRQPALETGGPPPTMLEWMAGKGPDEIFKMLLFGLCSPGFGAILDNEESSIQFYRDLARQYDSSPTRGHKPLLIIRCLRQTLEGDKCFLCTATPLFNDADGEGRHYRWVPEGLESNPGSDDETVATLDCDDLHAETTYGTSRYLWCNPPVVIKRACRGKGVKMRRWRILNETASQYSDDADRHYYYSSGDGEDGTRIRGYELLRWPSMGVGDPVQLYYLKHTDAIFQKEQLTPSLKQVVRVLRSEKLHHRRFINFIYRSRLVANLVFFSNCWSIFREMGGSTISPNILSLQDLLLKTYSAAPTPPRSRHRPPMSDVASSRPADKLLSLLRGNISTEGAFALLCFLETGNVEIPEKRLAGVFAMAREDSLYIASYLLSDPGTSSSGSKVGIRKVKGNIGRSGVAFLIGPGETRVRELDPSTWRMVNHKEFDGKLEDAFQDISLHLRFTGYELPIDIDPEKRGYKHTDAFLAEAIVSAHSAGKWVSDLNLSALTAPNLHRVNPFPSCKPHTVPTSKPDSELVSIENWEELLDPPVVPGVFKAHGNWQARLAATCMSVQLRYQTFLFGNHGCWHCATMLFAEWKKTYGQIREPRGRHRGAPPPRGPSPGPPPGWVIAPKRKPRKNHSDRSSPKLSKKLSVFLSGMRRDRRKKKNSTSSRSTSPASSSAGTESGLSSATRSQHARKNPKTLAKLLAKFTTSAFLFGGRRIHRKKDSNSSRDSSPSSSLRKTVMGANDTETPLAGPLSPPPPLPPGPSSLGSPTPGHDDHRIVFIL